MIGMYQQHLHLLGRHRWFPLVRHSAMRRPRRKNEDEDVRTKTVNGIIAAAYLRRILAIQRIS
jgi:hypothetical protein